jgi:putative PIG3 family NAD(P)H quinone oxidoreductase
MKVIQFDQPGEPEELYLGEQPDPQPGPGELLVRVAATALNRADLLQRRGRYPVPPGASEILGLEMAGTVMDTGAGVSDFSIGDNVCALLDGGGYAQYVTIPAPMALRLPDNLSFTKAAAIPEVFLTAFQALHWLADLQPGETVLLHAGASGVGTAAIQLAKLIGARVFVTASGPKHETCTQLGADRAFDYRSPGWAEQIRQATDGEGVAVIVDFVGAPYWATNIDLLARDGRLVLLGFLGGTQVEQFDLAPLLMKRLRITGSTLRSRSREYKIRLTQDFHDRYWTAFAEGRLYPVVDSIYDWEEVAAAHRYMEANANQGKIVLTIGE